MAKVTLGRAAQHLGVAPQLLFGYAESGHLTLERDADSGADLIDTLDLFKVVAGVDDPACASSPFTVRESAGEPNRLAELVLTQRRALRLLEDELTAVRRENGELMEILKAQARMLEERPGLRARPEPREPHMELEEWEVSRLIDEDAPVEVQVHAMLEDSDRVAPHLSALDEDDPPARRRFSPGRKRRGQFAPAAALVILALVLIAAGMTFVPLP
jgi:hypothetical protein